MRAARVAPDEISYNSMISSCAAGGRADGAEAWLREMHQARLRANAKSYNAVIHACSRGGQPDRAAAWLKAMLEASVTPNDYSFASVIDGYSKASSFKHIMSIIQHRCQYLYFVVLLSTLYYSGGRVADGAGMAGPGGTGRMRKEPRGLQRGPPERDNWGRH